MAVPICPLCGTTMEFRWEPFVHDPTVRRAAKVSIWFTAALLLWDGWSLRLPTLDLLFSFVVIVTAIAVLGSKPVVRCDGCAYTVNAS